MKHRAQFQDEKLADCFPPTLGYYFSKIFEALHNGTYFSLGKVHVEMVAGCLTKLRDMLKARGEWGIHDSVNYEYKLLEYPLSELNSFFTDREASKFDERDMYIFCSFVKDQFKTLQQIASEFDEQYASPPASDG